MVIETLHAADADASGERPQIGLVIKNLVPGGLSLFPSLLPSLPPSLPSLLALALLARSLAPSLPFSLALSLSLPFALSHPHALSLGQWVSG